MGGHDVAESKLQVKAQECFYLGSAPDYPRDSVRVPTKHRTVLITREITWQRVLPAPPVPAQTNDSLSTEERGSTADDESTSDGVGGGVVEVVVDELEDDLAHLNNLDVTWGFDLDAFLQERRQQAPAAGDAGDGKPRREVRLKGVRWTPPWSRQGGLKSRRELRLKGALQASLAPARGTESEARASSQGGSVDASSALGRKGRQRPQYSINYRNRPKER